MTIFKIAAYLDSGSELPELVNKAKAETLKKKIGNKQRIWRQDV